jgi:predicted Zn finger-like uncharacterized protein
MATTMTVQCPSCETSFPVDPAKVPEGGVRTQCTVCRTMFRVDRPSEEAWESVDPLAAATAAESLVSESWDDETVAETEHSGVSEMEEALAEFEAAEGLGVDQPGADPVEQEDAGASMDPGAISLDELPETEVAEPLTAMEAGDPKDGDRWDAQEGGEEADESGPVATDEEMGLGGGWVIERDDGADVDAPDVERLDTVEEGLRTALDSGFMGEGDAAGLQDDALAGEGDSAMSDFVIGDDVVFGDADLTAPIEEVEESLGEVVSAEESEIDDTAGVAGEPLVDDAPDLGPAAEFGGLEVDHGEPAGEGPPEPEPEEEFGGVMDSAAVHVFDAVLEVDEVEPEVETVESEFETVEPEVEAVESGFQATELEVEEADPEAVETEIEAAEAHAGENGPEVEEEVAAPDVAPPPSAGGFQFGKRDPHEKARRLARVLVSDMITYNPDRHASALANGTLREDFEEEIDKSWTEYVEQVGTELAESTSYWTDALNDILARGESLF